MIDYDDDAQRERFDRWYIMSYARGAGGAPGPALTTIYCPRCKHSQRVGFVWWHEEFGHLFQCEPSQSRKVQFEQVAGGPLPEGYVGRGWERRLNLTRLDPRVVATTACRRGHAWQVHYAEALRNALSHTGETLAHVPHEASPQCSHRHVSLAAWVQDGQLRL